MNRRQLLASAAALTAFPAQAKASEDSRLRALLDAFWEETLDVSPQFATLLGLDTGKRAGLRSQLGDASRGGRTAWVATQAARVKRLRAIDRGKLSETARIDFDVVDYQARRNASGGARFDFGEGAEGFGYAPYSPYVVSQLSGPYQAVPDFLDSNHPVATAADAEGWLSRLAAYPAALDASTQAFGIDTAKSIVPPDFVLATTLKQLEQQRAMDPATNAMSAGLVRKAKAAGVAGNWGARAAALITSKVNPALDRQIAAVRAARSTPDAGVWKIKDGDAYYAGALAFHTTTTLTPQQVHDLGLAQVAELSGQLDRLLRAQGLSTGTVGERLTSLGKRPENLWPNTDAGRADLLKSLNVQMDHIRTLLPRAFRTLPKAPVEIVRVPPDIEAGAPGGYALPASADGTRAGRYYINLKDTADWPKFNLPTLTYHEAFPGHQWQGAISDGSSDIPALRRYAGGYAAYGEGWALYAEDLAAELGVYDGDPLGRIGYLQSLLFRAVRLVVDTGLHFKRWDRAKATNTMIALTGFAPGRAQREIDRYCVWPGQACSYKVGHTEWVRLRRAVAAKQGARFDLKAFHEVLRLGDMPLTVLAQVVMARA